MNGLIGSISGISKTFNDMNFGNTIEGIKTANYLYNRVKTAKREQQEEKIVSKENENINFEELTNDIKDDMER